MDVLGRREVKCIPWLKGACCKSTQNSDSSMHHPTHINSQALQNVAFLPIASLRLIYTYPFLAPYHLHQYHSKAQSIGTTYLEKEPHNKHLQPSHTNHHQALNNTEVKDTSLCASNCAEIPVLSGTEVLLVARDCRELARELEDGFLQRGSLLWGGALFGGD